MYPNINNGSVHTRRSGRFNSALTSNQIRWIATIIKSNYVELLCWKVSWKYLSSCYTRCNVRTHASVEIKIKLNWGWLSLQCTFLADLLGGTARLKISRWLQTVRCISFISMLLIVICSLLQFIKNFLRKHRVSLYRRRKHMPRNIV